MKIKKYLIIGISSVILLVAVFYCTSMDLIYKVFYNGDRISITATVFVDDKAVVLNKEDISFNNEEFKYDIDGDKILIFSKADEYNVYRVVLKLKDSKIILSLAHFNWWDVNSYMLDIHLDTKTGKLTYDCTYTYLTENGHTCYVQENNCIKGRKGIYKMSFCY